MDPERINRLSFYFFMGTLAASLALILFFTGRLTYESWVKKEAPVLTVYAEPGILPLINDEIKAFSEKADGSIQIEALTRNDEIDVLARRKGIVIILAGPLPGADAGAAEVTGNDLNQELIRLPTSGAISELHVISGKSHGGPVAEFSSFLRSEAGKEIAARHKTPKRKTS